MSSGLIAQLTLVLSCASGKLSGRGVGSRVARVCVCLCLSLPPHEYVETQWETLYLTARDKLKMG